MSLLDLSPELLLCISEFLSQVDLLNVSLTCSHLRSATKPELYREYRNVRIYGRSIQPFLDRIIDEPELRKYVRKLQLKPWGTLDDFNPRYHEHINAHAGPDDPYSAEPTREEFENALVKRHPQPSEAEYMRIAQTAKNAGVIAQIYPYEIQSVLVDRIVSRQSSGVPEGEYWYDHAFDEDQAISEIHYDRKFCQLLRAGIEDPLIVLLVALLPNVQEFLLHGAPADVNTLEWRANHDFASMKSLTACATDGDSIWPLAWMGDLLPKGKLLRLEASGAGSWYQDMEHPIDGPEGVRSREIKLDGLLHVRYVDLQDCCLKSSDVKTLLYACRNLETFMYSSKVETREIYSPSPARMIELLDPHKETLKFLSLDLDIDNYEHWDQMEPELIDSLTHFTALEIIDTTPEMWHAVEEGEFDMLDMEEDSSETTERRLCFRLPPNAHTVMFHSSTVEELTSLEQIENVIKMRAEVLPNLRNLYIGAAIHDSEYIDDIQRLASISRDSLKDGTPPLEVITGQGGMSTVFNTFPPKRPIPEVTWCKKEGRYAPRRRKPSLVVRTLDGIIQKYRDMGMDDEDDLRAAIRQDADMSVVKALGEDEVAEYESSDAESVDF